MRKVFVEVMAKFDTEGNLVPISLKWEDGKEYSIDKLYEHKKAASLKVGGQGERYRVKICNQEKYIFLEEGKWLMEGK